MRFRSLAVILVGSVAAAAMAYPLGRTALLPAAELPPAEAAAESAPVPPAAEAPAPQLVAPAKAAVRAPAKGGYSVIGVGDIMMGSDYPSPIMDARVAPGADPADVIGPEMLRLFKGGDVVFGNYEGTIHTNSDNAKSCSNPAVCFTFRSPPFHAKYLASVGFTLVSNANNHSRDFGEANRAQTYRYLTGAGLAVSGADTPGTRIGVQTLPDGTRFALVAFGHNPGLMQVTDLARLTAMVHEADRVADVVMVSCHIGGEGEGRSAVTRQTEMFLGENRGNPYAFAHTAVDAGADIVFCHGPHIPRAIEVYKGRFIAYSLGNFWTYGRFNLSNTAGYAPIAALKVGADGALQSARIVSARQVKPGGPFLDPSGAAAARIEQLSRQDFPEAGIAIDADGNVSWRR
ncbi:CapA family protein [Sphingomonas canadensis]|uniref:CapA family protein n=1 Tax=Sphingomonas canadensis TaxID=1219257 RepID=A0ABW3HCP9_9SPHN|nr:CapA family protein [Sphingomonas canadensis]MCW3836757.1 CapA family protein [Sphingomonas canadensis]